MTTEGDTPGTRLYRIRLALGDGVRDEMPMRAFVALVERRTGKAYQTSTISMMERGGQKLTLEDIDRFASVDPLNRGRAWLAWGDEPPNGESRPPVVRVPPHQAIPNPHETPTKKAANDRGPRKRRR